MQITLKQKDIEAALKGYIAHQGINLAGRSVEITFTAGRKESGLSAELNIEDAVIPLETVIAQNDVILPGGGLLEVVYSGPPLEDAAAAVNDSDPEPEGDVFPEEDPEKAVAAVPLKTASVSLFG